MPGGFLLFMNHQNQAGVPVPAPTYELSWWQTRLFKHKADLWRPVRTAAADGDVSAAFYTQAATDVPCYQDRKPSASQMEMFGRTEQDDLFTRDIFWMHEHQTVGDTWCIVLKTLDAQGEPHPDFGKAWICAGDARKRIDTIGAEGHIEIASIAQPELPPGVS